MSFCAPTSAFSVIEVVLLCMRHPFSNSMFNLCHVRNAILPLAPRSPITAIYSASAMSPDVKFCRCRHGILGLCGGGQHYRPPFQLNFDDFTVNASLFIGSPPVNAMAALHGSHPAGSFSAGILY